MSDFKVTYKGNFSTEMIHLESGEKIITDASYKVKEGEILAQ